MCCCLLRQPSSRGSTSPWPWDKHGYCVRAHVTAVDGAAALLMGHGRGGMARGLSYRRGPEMSGTLKVYGFVYFARTRVYLDALIEIFPTVPWSPSNSHGFSEPTARPFGWGPLTRAGATVRCGGGVGPPDLWNISNVCPSRPLPTTLPAFALILGHPPAPTPRPLQARKKLRLQVPKRRNP